MYRLILSPIHTEILKEAFTSYFHIRQNSWEAFLQDIEAANDTVSLFEEAYKTACPDYKELYKPVKDKHGEVEYVEGFDKDIENVFLKVFKDDMFFNGTKELRYLLYVIEEFMRMRMGQFFMFTDDVAENGWKYNKSDPGNDKKFNAYIKRRNKARDMFDDAYRKTLCPKDKKTEQVLIAEDMYDVIKHQIWLDSPNMHKSYDTWSCPPMNWSGLEMPQIEVVKNA